MSAGPPRHTSAATIPAVTPAWLEQAALNHLARYATSGPRLARLLRAKVERAARRARSNPTDPAQIDDWIATLIENLTLRRLIDDAAYAAARARRLRRQAQPMAAIRRALRTEGLAPAQIATALAAVASEQPDEETPGDLAAALAYVRRRRLGPFRPPAERDGAHAKDLAALARRGFNRRTAEQALAAPDES